MNTTGKTILITGGGAGIGLQMARLFSEKGNKVIITGRTENTLKEAAAKVPGLSYIVADVTSESDILGLAEQIEKNYPDLSVLINNAGQAFVHQSGEISGGFGKAQAEMLTNYLSVIRLSERLLPVLGKQPEAAIVNVSSIAAFASNTVLTTYAASKAALHSYTQSLRIILEKTSAIKVFELMPPLVNTEFSKEIGGINGIAPEEVAAALWDGLQNETYEIHVGKTAELYKIFLSSPQEAFRLMNA